MLSDSGSSLLRITVNITCLKYGIVVEMERLNKAMDAYRSED